MMDHIEKDNVIERFLFADGKEVITSEFYISLIKISYQYGLAVARWIDLDTQYASGIATFGFIAKVSITTTNVKN